MVWYLIFEDIGMKGTEELLIRSLKFSWKGEASAARRMMSEVGDVVFDAKAEAG